ncbi:vacuolar protein sorting-associated protein 37A [Nilaparvata lugens]|uniref:vacuolar protein sorting-associated protein 37A n=1 Tax=Nilaparvata lugens TaxID=108931 RepID=UPI00193DF66B|nr:vacuolar protein sorting-associated protein 37A [Nilaparvata lugens]
MLNRSNIFLKADNFSVERKKQIDTLKIFNANVSEVQEDVEYKIEFNSGGKPLALIVKLSPEFPLEKPVLQIVPTVVHNWVTESGLVTSAPGLLNFTRYSDLGRVVQAIIREFELRPPPFLSDEQSPSASVQQNACSRDGGQSVGGAPLSPNNFSYSTTPPSTYWDYTHSHGSNATAIQPNCSNATPVQPSMFPELSSMSTDELKRLYSSVDRIDELLESTKAVQDLDRTKDDLITKIEEVSKENLSKEPVLNKLREDILERQEVFSNLKSQFEVLNSEYQKLADRFSPESICESLQAAVIKSDEKSEAVAEMFLEGEMDVDAFLVAYENSRTVSHCRKTKEEKLSHQLSELKRASY